MGQIVLDTDVASLYYKRRLPADLHRRVIGHRTYVAFATAGELRKWGIVRQWGWVRRTGVQLWLESKRVLPYSLEVAWIWGDMAGRATLRGRNPGANDLWIAACCVQRGLPLLTLNRRDFEELQRHEGLRLLAPGTGDAGVEVRSPAPNYPTYPLVRSIERTEGRPAATWSQVAPASCDR
jgi:predicted nucleic acid-binding protein